MRRVPTADSGNSSGGDDALPLIPEKIQLQAIGPSAPRPRRIGRERLICDHTSGARLSFGFLSGLFERVWTLDGIFYTLSVRPWNPLFQWE